MLWELENGRLELMAWSGSGQYVSCRGRRNVDPIHYKECSDTPRLGEYLCNRATILPFFRCQSCLWCSHVGTTKHADRVHWYLEVKHPLLLWTKLCAHFDVHKYIMLHRPNRNRPLFASSIWRQWNDLHNRHPPNYCLPMLLWPYSHIPRDDWGNSLDIPPSNMVHQYKYHSNKYIKYYDLISMLLVAEAQNELIKQDY